MTMNSRNMITNMTFKDVSVEEGRRKAVPVQVRTAKKIMPVMMDEDTDESDDEG